MTRVPAVGAIILILLAACGSEATESGESLASTTKMSGELTAALDEVRSNVDALLESIASGAPTKPRTDNSKQQSCNDAESAPTGQFRSQFGYIVDTGALKTTALLDNIKDFCASRG